MFVCQSVLCLPCAQSCLSVCPRVQCQMFHPRVRCRVLVIIRGIRRRAGASKARPPVAPQSFGKKWMENPDRDVSTLSRFSEKATCLARRASSPPSTRCPSGWYWSTQLTSCAPANPEAQARSSLTCGKDSIWSPSTLMCQRAATPSRRSPSKPSPSSGQSSHRRSLKSRSISLCPAGLYACPILRAGDFSDYECVDPIYDLQHCGGCSMDGRGEDCTAIEGVWNVECIRARCSGSYIHQSS